MTSEQWIAAHVRGASRPMFGPETHLGGAVQFVQDTTPAERQELYQEAAEVQRMRQFDVATARRVNERMRRADELYSDLVNDDIEPGSEDAAALWRHCYARMIKADRDSAEKGKRSPIL